MHARYPLHTIDYRQWLMKVPVWFYFTDKLKGGHTGELYTQKKIVVPPIVGQLRNNSFMQL